MNKYLPAVVVLRPLMTTAAAAITATTAIAAIPAITAEAILVSAEAGYGGFLF